MSNRERLRCNVSKGHTEKLLADAKNEGGDLEDYLTEISRYDIVIGDNNIQLLLKHLKIDNPFKNGTTIPNKDVRTKDNTEELDVSLKKGCTDRLSNKAIAADFKTRGKIGLFLDKICDYPILILKTIDEEDKE